MTKNNIFNEADKKISNGVKIIADLHLHSKYSRAVSPDMTLPKISEWAEKKGIDIISAADFTHPLWFKELKEQLMEAEQGLYKLKNKDSKTRFILTTEISCIYTKNGKGRRAHVLIFAPNLETVEKINSKLGWIGNLKSDGRPILGLDAKELLKIVLSISKDCLVVPAHIWTPWFSVFGSKSGFNSLAECFDELAKEVYAVETGLSSDPAMNWRIEELDDKTIVSGSDAHSLLHLGREACVFEIDKEKLSYNEIVQIIKEKNREKFLYTVEFFPEEGMYHFDGHRDCKVCLSPQETKKYNGICPKCGRGVTVGVMARVQELADKDRKEGFKLENAIPFKSLIPLYEIIADVLDVGVKTKSVMTVYDNLVQKFGNEFFTLLDASKEEIKNIAGPKIAEAVFRCREGKVKLIPGYDGEYGKVKIFGEEEIFTEENNQNSLF